jgi:16S rRNA processing protein RimM
VTAVSARDWVAIAMTLRSQGRRGELLCDRLSDVPDLFRDGLEVYLVGAEADAPAASSSTRILEGHWLPTGKNAGRIVLKFSGCDSISDAEALRGQKVLIPAGDLPKLDADTFFVRDLLGCSVWDGEREVGVVQDIEFATTPDGRTRLEDAAPLISVQPEEGEPLLIPFVRAWLETVDLAGKRIVMHLPYGLLETAATITDEQDDAAGDSADEDE